MSLRARPAGAPLRLAALAKQIPLAESFQLEDGRLVRRGVETEMNAYCRRAVAEGVTLAHDSAGSCTVFTLGPPGAEDVLREAVAWGADDGVHVCDPALAGSDTLATARALAAALRRCGPFDLVLVGRNTLDGETGQVGPELAELLGLPFASGVRRLEDAGAFLRLELENDDGTQEVEVDLPAVLSVAERLCEPCKVDPEGRAAVDAARLSRLGRGRPRPGALGGGRQPHGGGRHAPDGARPGRHGARRAAAGPGGGGRAPAGPPGCAHPARPTGAAAVAVPVSVPVRTEERGAVTGRPVAVVVEPGRTEVARELLAAAARLGAEVGAAVHALVPAATAARTSWAGPGPTSSSSWARRPRPRTWRRRSPPT